jgi:hypothetical protein
MKTNLHIHFFIKGKGKVVPVLFLTEHYATKAYWGSGAIAPCILDLGTRWRCMVSFMPWLLSPPAKELLVPIGYEAG